MKLWFIALLLMTAAACGAHAGAANEATTTAVRPATEPLLSERRIRAHTADTGAWLAYLQRSRAQRAVDSARIAAELAAIGQPQMTQAPYARSFEIRPQMTAGFFASDSAGFLADNIVSFQAPNGGWSKHVDYGKGPRARGQSYFGESRQWSWISTFDNSSTTEQMRFLALRDSVRPDQRYRDSWLRGFRFILAAQYPNGCWPQVWPLDGGYHDAATFNDDVTTNILATLNDASSGKPAFIADADRALARTAVSRGLECVLKAQVMVDGRLTAWGQQHDPLTLAPTSARSYEPSSLSAQESANLLRFLIRQRNPSPQLTAAIHAAAAWLKERALYGYTYDFEAGRKDAPGEGPVWARMYEIGTNRPIFSDRNGIKLYDWNELRDRRTGYAWYTYSPVLALRQYDRWARTHPVNTQS